MTLLSLGQADLMNILKSSCLIKKIVKKFSLFISRISPLSRQVDIKALAAKTEGFAGSDIAGVCNQAALKAVRRVVQKIRQDPDKPVTVEVTENDLDQAINEASA